MLPRTYYNEQDIRKKQIDTLKIFNDNVVEISENAEYKVDFTAEGKNMSLNVVLGPEFPNEKPTIFINPPVSHPWVAENSNQIVGAPGMLNYSLHSDLGRVVQAIIREFQLSLPNLSNSDEKSSDESPQSQVVPLPMLQDLNELSVEELREILENTDLQVRRNILYYVCQ